MRRESYNPGVLGALSEKLYIMELIIILVSFSLLLYMTFNDNSLNSFLWLYRLYEAYI